MRILKGFDFKLLLQKLFYGYKEILDTLWYCDIRWEEKLLFYVD